MKKYLPILQKCTLFGGISPSDSLALLSCMNATVRRYRKNETVLAEGDPAHQIGIVLEGAVLVGQIDIYGNRHILAVVTAGDLFAEVFACAGLAALPLEVTAKENCAVLLLDSRKITHPCSSACGFHHNLIGNLLQIVARKNLHFRRRLEIVTAPTTEDKLMTYLLAEAKDHNSRRFTIPYDRQQLADFLAVDRSGLSAVIGKLTKKGVLISHKNHFELL